MILRLTVEDAQSSTRRDVEVLATPTSTVGSLLESLPDPVGGRRCFVGGVELDPRAVVADSPLIPGAVIRVGAPGPVFRHVPGQTAGVLSVAAGPDTGLIVALAPGTHTVARSSRAAVCLRDLDVSRNEHARLEISGDGQAVVVDGGSTNGTFLDGARVSGRMALKPGSVLRVGSDELRWTPHPVEALRAIRSADGRLDFDRAFAAAPAIPRTEVTLPVRQTVVRNTAMMALSALLPVGGAVLMALTMHRASMLWFGLLGVLGFLVMQLIQNKQHQESEAAFAKAKKTAQDKIDAHVAEEQRVRRLLGPDPLQIAETAVGVRPDLWPRRMDSAHGLVLRVGVADQQAAVDLRGEPWEGFQTPVLPMVPVTVDLRATGVLGVVGPDKPVQSLLRWLLIQLSALRGPDDLRIVVITAAGHDGPTWARWLPHVDAGHAAAVPCSIGNTDVTRAARVQELRRLITARRAERAASSTVRFAEEVVVVLDGALALRELPGMDEVLRDGPSVGVYLICADQRGMNECRGLCEVDQDTLRLTATPDDHPVTARPDVLGEAAVEPLARALAPMRDRLTLASTLNAVPDHVRFLDLLGVGVPTADDVVGLWSRGQGPQTRVVLGADAGGPVTVDLARQGPHTMLGGATGAGKSILLQTLVTSLLLANRPDELNLVLVDFKGGSAFLPFQHCPHVVALIRSTGETPADVFDSAAAARVLASVRAEVSRRESLLARYDGEIDRYWRRRRANPAGMPPLPRLVMVFDEFARVLETSPDFLKELVNVAAKGRSLGMHLVLATQSLQGKLSPELKNNISLRISLRQNEPADSTEVLGAPDAAAIPGSLRGRGLILCTTGETRVPQVFQSGYLGNPPPSGTAQPVSVHALTWTDFGAPRPPEQTKYGEAPADQDLAIAAIEEAARRGGLTAPFRPLLPPLPVAMALEDLADHQTAAPPSTAVPFGLADDPAEQAQPAEFFDLASTDRLMVAGGPQSGRTTFARTLITSLATRLRPDQAHLYVFERHPAGLSDYSRLPHCGGVFSPAEPDRIRRLVTWLDQEVHRRATTRSMPQAAPLPRIVVIIDGWEHFEDHSDPAFAETSLLTTLRAIVAAGAPLGVHIVPLGGHDMLNHKLPTYYTRRLLLPFPKEETRRAHLTSAMTSPPLLPGRAIDAATGRHIHICHPTAPPTDLPTQFPDADPAQLPRQFPALPSLVTLDELPWPETPQSPTWIPLGVGGPEHTTIGVDLIQGPHLLLLSGPHGSGRTTTAAALAHSLRRAGIGVLALATPRSPLPHLLPEDSGVRVLTSVSLKDSDLRDTAAAFGDGPYAVILDDADHITLLPTQQGFTDAPTLLDDIARLSARGHHALILTADATPVLTGFPSPLARLINTIVTAGHRILLTPAGRPTAVAHSITLEPDQYFTAPPGRGYLAAGRSPVLIQLATPRSDQRAGRRDTR
ncbi:MULTISPECIES: FtsK/SpoIIIE domain-containing protein [unclassified Streptomyces]|uniref:FtsK/SpoIIIE domain-containing protein n=1 Tax=unclassified Streptomyces TaxID=2593676 RepID=UPI00336A12A0